MNDREFQKAYEDELTPSWGTWATVGWTFLIALVAIGIQVLAGSAAVIGTMRGDPGITVTEIEQVVTDNGLLLSLATLLEMPFVLGLAWYFASLVPGTTPKEYLALKMPGWKETLIWSAIFLVYLALSDGIRLLQGEPLIPEYMERVYHTAGWLPLLWLTLMVAAPLIEESIFRGFLFKGLLKSPLKAPGTMVFTALSWSVLHLQYEHLTDMLILFFGGVLLGLARLRSHSLILCVYIHFLWNLVATLEMVFFLK